MGNLIPIFVVLFFILLFFSPLYWTGVIKSNASHNRWNDYRIKEIDYEGEKYYVGYVYCGRFYFKKIYLPFDIYVPYPIRHVDTGKCKLFYSEDDLTNLLKNRYEDDLKKTNLNKMI